MLLRWLLGACLLVAAASAPYAAGPDQAGDGRARGGPVKNGQVKSGTGFFVSADNMLVTSAHVVTDCGSIAVFPIDGVERQATIVASDSDLDIAILWVNGKALGYYLDDAEARTRVGDRLYTVGYAIVATEPYRPFYFTGTVQGESSLANGNRVLVVHAYVPAGSSGAPLVDPQARLVGAIIGHYTAEPDQGVVVPVESIRAFALRQGVSLPTGPARGVEALGRDEALLNVSALVQCRGR